MAAVRTLAAFLASLLVCSFCLVLPCGAQETVPITIDTVPTGLQVDVDGASYTAPQVFQWTPLSGHTLGAPSPQGGGTGVRHLFDYWSNGGDQYHTVFTPYSQVTHAARFITQHELTTPVNLPAGGRVRPDCSLGCWYDSGQRVSLIALPGSGYAFDRWDVDCTGTNPSVSVIMTAPRICQANLLQCSDPSPVRIGTTGYPTFEMAYNAAGDNAVIKMCATNLLESLRLNRSGVAVTLRGGHRCWEESSPSSYTLLQGSMTSAGGAVTVENLMILSGTPPVITSFVATPATVPAGSPSTLSWSVADATTVSIDNGVGNVDHIAGTKSVTPLATTTYTLTASNPYGTDTAQVTVTATSPGITTFKATPDVISSGGSSKLTWDVTGAASVVIDQDIGRVDPLTEWVVNPTTTTVYTITVTNPAGTKTKKVTVGVIPQLVAPPIDQTVATTVYASTSFLYTATNPVQTGMAPETIEPKRAAVLRGKVLKEDGLPLSGVTVTVLNHPEYGQTISRDDGMFDMVVNGGGLMNVRYTKTDHLTVQRQRDIPWQDFMWLPEIRMIKADLHVTFVDLASQSDFQVVRGSVVTDERGTRQSTVLIPKGSRAWMVFPDGHEEEIASMTVRATEFTEGVNGEKKMPAELPPTSAYTYCEEFTVDEAVAAGAPEVRFSEMAISYNENFLDFPVGTGIPLGSYDRERGVWIPSDNGKVIRIVSITNGLADLDTDGNGSIDNGASLGVTEAERRQLALLYPQGQGQTFWRVLVPHFTKPWDKNMGTSCKEPCPNPETAPPWESEQTCVQEGSVIECQKQALGQVVNVTGTPFRLYYKSDRVPGRTDAFTLNIPLTSTAMSPTLQEVTLKASIAGQEIQRSYKKADFDLYNLSDTLTWDGRDAYGRMVQARQPVTLEIGYGYNLIYQRTDKFGYNGNGTLITTGSGLFTLWNMHKGGMGVWDARGQGLGGWTLDIHHAYDPQERVIYYGDGSKRSANSVDRTVSTVAGGGYPHYPGNNEPATQSSFYQPKAVAVAPDGSFYVADYASVRRVGTDGIIRTVAGRHVTSPTGMPQTGYSGDGGPAINALLNQPSDVAVGPDGSVYIADSGNSRIRRIGPDGIITTFAGNGGCMASCASSLEDLKDVPATQTPICGVSKISFGPDGSLYLLHSLRPDVIVSFIRRVGPDGIMSKIAGTCYGPCVTEGARATDSDVKAGAIAVGPDGSVNFNSFCGGPRLWRVEVGGRVTRVAGNGSFGSAGDGGPALDASFNNVCDLALGPDGSIYVTQYNPACVRVISPDGLINKIAGNCDSGYGFSGDKGLATQAMFWLMNGATPGPGGDLYIADGENGRIRRVAVGPMLPGISVNDILLPSENGGEMYLFNSKGKHLRTYNALTAAVKYAFAYSRGLLVSVTDGDGNVTTIERDGADRPVAIVSPYGQRTTLTLDSNGYLTGITNPATETAQFVYTGDGLMTDFRDPLGGLYHFTYDGRGRLTGETDPAGGSQMLSLTRTPTTSDVTHTTGMNRATNYRVERHGTGDEHYVNTFSSGVVTDSLLKKKDGYERVTFPDGSVTTQQLGPDPRFSMQAPVLKSQTIAMPSGLTATAATARTATLSVADNPLTLTSLTDDLTINGRKHTTKYTNSTKTVTDTSPVGRQVTSKIDLQGRLVEHQIAGVLPVQFIYDAQGRLSSVKQGSGSDLRESTFQHNAQGFLQSATDPLLRTVIFEYDQVGRVTREVLPDNREVTYAYDAGGNMTSLTPPGKPSHVFTYTPVDLMAEYTPPDIGIGTVKTQYTYNTDRQMTQVLRPDGLAIGFGYDSGGRPSQVTYPGGPLAYTYDPVKGYLTRIDSPGGNSVSYAYDGQLITSKSWAGDVTGSVSWTYDNSFRITGININGGTTIAFQYDNDNLITKAGDLTLTRSAQNGFLAGSTLGNVTDAWTYNTFGEPASYVAKYGSTEIFKQQFTYDKLGRIAQRIETVEGTTNTYDYLYDPAGRLTEVKKNGSTTSTYSYDSNDNRLTGPSGTETYTYDAQDRLLQYGTSTYSYTANGELLSKTTGGQTTLYNYDVLGNLKSVTLPGSTLIEYIVDGQNRRIGKKVNSMLTQKFLYRGGLKPIAELDAGNNVTSVFVHGSRYTTPDYMIKSGVTYRIISDRLGSPRIVMNIADQTVLQRMDYDEFGNVVLDTNPGFQPFGFAGGVYDGDTRLVRFGARDYDAEIGRWALKDPIRFSGKSHNLYAYASNDPVNRVDRTGMRSLWQRLCTSPFGEPQMPWEWFLNLPRRLGWKIDDLLNAFPSEWTSHLGWPSDHPYIEMPLPPQEKVPFSDQINAGLDWLMKGLGFGGEPISDYGGGEESETNVQM